MCDICAELVYENADESVRLAHQAYSLSKKLRWPSGISSAANQVAISKYMTSEFDSAIHYNNISMDIDLKCIPESLVLLLSPSF